MPLYRGSLAALGLESTAHDVRLMEDNWESPTLNAWGLGWEVWCDGMEITQLTYFQHVGGFDCMPIGLEITYGLERLALYLQGCDSVYAIDWNGCGTSYGDVFHRFEREHSIYNFDVADVATLHSQFDTAERCCQQLLAEKPDALIYPAWDWCLQASHLFNLLEARGVLGVYERQAHVARVRALARQCGRAWIAAEQKQEQESDG